MSCYVVVRRARPEDEAARAALLRGCVHEYFVPAFLMFFFHELTLQGVVLCAAVLFIFAGAGAGACGAVLPAAAALVAAGVCAAHQLAAARARAGLRAELAGWVAEARAPPGLGAPPSAPRLYSEAEWRRRDAAPEEGAAAHVVGTVSLSEWREDGARGRLHALGVARAWRRRGVARALAGAAGGAAAAAGLRSVEAAASALQGAARGALHAAGWRLRASYHRPLLGAALSLPMLHLGKDLPEP